MITRNVNIVVILISLLWVASGFSQNQYYVHGDSIVQIYRLQEVVVSSNRYQLNPSKTIELDQHQIKARNATTVSQLLDMEPGINFISGYKGESEVKIRGFRSQDVLVLLDGRPINPGYYGKVDLSMLPLNNLAKITVIKGPASVAFGANHTGGVINIVTKNGFENPQTTAEAKFGAYQSRNLSLNHSRKINNLNYWISGFEQHANGIRMSKGFQPTAYEDGGRRDLSFYHKAGVSGKIAWLPIPDLTMTMASDYSWAKKEIPVATRFIPGERPRYWEFPEWKRNGASLSSEWKVTPGFTLKSVLFMDRYFNRLIEYTQRDMIAENVDWNSVLKNVTTGGLLHVVLQPHPAHHLLCGIQVRHDRMQKKPDSDEPWYSHFIRTSSLFVQDDIRISKNTIIVAGIGLHYFQTENGTTQSSRAPFVSFQQTLPGQWRVYSSYSYSVRYPTLNNLYSQVSGNQALRPESTDKFESGVRKTVFFSNQYQFCSLDLAYYYNQMEDMIYRATRSLRYKNLSEAEMQGIDLSVIWSCSKYLSGELGYSFIDIIHAAPEMNDYIPRHKVHLSMRANTPFGLQMNYELAYQDQRTFYYSTDYQVQFPDYVVHNVNLIQKLTDSFSLRVEIRNMLDEYYEEEYGYPQAGRQVWGGVEMRF